MVPGGFERGLHLRSAAPHAHRDGIRVDLQLREQAFDLCPHLERAVAASRSQPAGLEERRIRLLEAALLTQHTSQIDQEAHSLRVVHRPETHGPLKQVCSTPSIADAQRLPSCVSQVGGGACGKRAVASIVGPPQLDAVPIGTL